LAPLSNAIYREPDPSSRQREGLLLILAFVFLGLTVLALNVAPAVRLEDWSMVGGRLWAAAVLPVWLMCSLLLRRQLDRFLPQRDPTLLPVALLLAGWGLLLIWRLTPAFAIRQLAWLVVSVVLLLLILRSPKDLGWLRRYRLLWLFLGVGLTFLTLIFGTSPSGAEPRLWLGWGGLYFQPSELLRLLLVVYLASYFADRLELGWWSDVRQSLPTIAPLLVIWGLSVALLVVQRDLGAGTLCLILLAALLYIAIGRWQVLIAAGASALLGGTLAYLLFGVVRQRIEAWLNPWADPIGGSYQLVQSLIAMASGGVLGRGPGLGAPGYVPAAHTDFIFTSVVEEWGWVGGVIMLALLAVLVGRGLRIARGSRRPFDALLGGGLAVSLGIQVVMIVGGNMRLLPLTGITLPFVSYGGSSLLTSFAGLGFLLILSGRQGPENRMKRPLRMMGLGLGAAWVGMIFALSWWTMVRAPTLTARTDNPRRALASLYSKRGSILDRHDFVLASSVGEQGAYERIYPSPSASAVVGFDSLRYGQLGVEQTMDSTLRGLEYYDPFTIWREYMLEAVPPPGLDVRLTLDREAQRVSSEALFGHRGAVVLLNASSGDILALASSPSFDSNRLDEDWSSLSQRDDAPFVQRAVQGNYQPGGALAPFLYSWAAWKGHAEQSGEEIDLGASFFVDGHEIFCAEETLAAPSLVEALRQGCPAALVLLGERLGGAELLNSEKAFSLGQSPSIRLLSVEGGFQTSVPQGADLRLEAVGQGALTVTPLGLARAFASLVNQGVMPSAHLVQAVRLPDGVWQELPPLGNEEVVIPDSVAKQFLDAFEDAEGCLEFNAGALAGGKGERLAWYLGACLHSGPGPIVVVVVMEDDFPAVARAIGRCLLQGVAYAGEECLLP
jgi:cell division protein FtsW (lipid II flippase)